MIGQSGLPMMNTLTASKDQAPEGAQSAVANAQGGDFELALLGTETDSKSTALKESDDHQIPLVNSNAPNELTLPKASDLETSSAGSNGTTGKQPTARDNGIDTGRRSTEAATDEFLEQGQWANSETALAINKEYALDAEGSATTSRTASPNALTDTALKIPDEAEARLAQPELRSSDPSVHPEVSAVQPLSAEATPVRIGVHPNAPQPDISGASPSQSPAAAQPALARSNPGAPAQIQTIETIVANNTGGDELSAAIENPSAAKAKALPVTNPSDELTYQFDSGSQTTLQGRNLHPDQMSNLLPVGSVSASTDSKNSQPQAASVTAAVTVAPSKNIPVDLTQNSAPQQVSPTIFPSSKGSTGIVTAQDDPAGYSLGFPASPGSTGSVRSDVSLVPAQPPSSDPKAVIQQINQAIIRMEGSRTEVVLDPVELGRVSLTFITKDEGVSVLVTADRAETAELLRRNSEQLHRDLSGAGYEEVELDFDQNHDEQADHQMADSQAEPTASDTRSISYRGKIADVGLDIRI